MIYWQFIDPVEKDVEHNLAAVFWGGIVSFFGGRNPSTKRRKMPGINIAVHYVPGTVSARVDACEIQRSSVPRIHDVDRDPGRQQGSQTRHVVVDGGTMQCRRTASVRAARTHTDRDRPVVRK